MSCIEPFKTHKWNGGNYCVREGCGVVKSESLNPGETGEGVPELQSDSLGMESMDSLKMEAAERTGTEPGKPGKPKDTKYAKRKLKAKDAEEERRANAKSAATLGVDAVEVVKSFVAQFLAPGSKLPGLMSEQRSRLIIHAARIMEELDWEVDGLYAAIAMFILAEAQITWEQYQAIQKEISDTAERTVGDGR